MGTATQQTTDQMPLHFLRLKEVKARLGVSGATIWAWSKSGKNGFPKPIKLGDNTTVWEASAIYRFAQSRIAASK